VADLRRISAHASRGLDGTEQVIEVRLDVSSLGDLASL
jgi:hypothetical protein